MRETEIPNDILNMFEVGLDIHLYNYQHQPLSIGIGHSLWASATSVGTVHLWTAVVTMPFSEMSTLAIVALLWYSHWLCFCFRSLLSGLRLKLDWSRVYCRWATSTSSWGNFLVLVAGSKTYFGPRSGLSKNLKKLRRGMTVQYASAHCAVVWKSTSPCILI